MSIVFHNPKNEDTHLMQELGKFDFEKNGMPNRFKKYMSFI